MSVPLADCVSATREEFLLPNTINENGNSSHTIAVETYDIPTTISASSSPCKSSPAKHSTTASTQSVVQPPCTLPLKSTTATLLATVAASPSSSSLSSSSSSSMDATIDRTTVAVASTAATGTDRPATATTAAATECATNVVPPNDCSPDLLKWKDMPKHLQFNRYIVEGYRPLTDAKGCMHSLFYFHNETVNIFTHGIPVLYILATVPYLLPWDEFRLLSWCHLLGTLAPWCGSFVYHLFMNLDHGEVVYYRLLKLDMFGIWMSQSFGAITFVTATAFCWKIKWIIIYGYCVLCLWGLYKALLAASPWQRRLCFLFPFVMRLHLVVLRMFKLAGGNTESMVHVYLQDGVSIIGGAIGAMNIPEKWLPGNVDFFLNSHNIMHVLVVVAVYSMHQATMRDLEWMSKSGCSNPNGTMSLETLGGQHHTDL